MTMYKGKTKLVIKSLGIECAKVLIVLALLVALLFSW